MPSSVELYGVMRNHLTNARDLQYEEISEFSHSLRIHGIDPKNATPLGNAIESALNNHGWNHVNMGAGGAQDHVLLTFEKIEQVRAVLEALAHHENLRKQAKQILEKLP